MGPGHEIFLTIFKKQNRNIVKISFEMTDADKLISTYLDPTLENEAQNLALNQLVTLMDTGAGCITIQELILRMGDQLTSVDDKIRSRASLLLAEVISKIHQPLTSNAIHQVAIFFRNRLSDYPSLTSALFGLQALISTQMARADPKYNDAQDIVLSVFAEVHVQSLSQSIRSQSFEFFNVFLSNEIAVNAVGGKFTASYMSPITSSCSSISNRASVAVADEKEPFALSVLEGIISSIDGEKDPRCLVASMKVLRRAISYFQLFVPLLAEKIFDISACYFPVSCKTNIFFCFTYI